MLFAGSHRQAVCITERTRQDLALRVTAKSHQISVPLRPVTRVGDEIIALAIKYPVIGAHQLVSPGILRKYGPPAAALDPHDAVVRIADKQFCVVRRPRHPATRPAHRRNGIDGAFWRNPINLPCLSARPKPTVSIEGEAFSVIETGSEHGELINIDLWDWLGGQHPSHYQSRLG